MEIDEIRKFIKGHYPNLDEILFFEMHQTEILLFEMARLKQKEIEELRKELKIQTKFKEAYLEHWQDSKEQNTKQAERIKQLKKKLKEVSIQAECYHNNEEMHQGNGSVYVTCKDCGIDL